MKKLELAAAAAFLLCVIFSFTTFAKDCGDIRKEVLRFHVLANSDSREDQDLKLKVRDRLLRENLYGDMVSREEAIEQTDLAKIEEIARDEILKNGCDYSVKAHIVNMYFTTRRYDNVTLPAGNYDALRVEIGEAKGQNWWCVMFPPLCVPAAGEKAQLSDVLTQNQEDIVENPPKYKIRWKSVELFEEGKHWFVENVLPLFQK